MEKKSSKKKFWKLFQKRNVQLLITKKDLCQ